MANSKNVKIKAIMMWLVTWYTPLYHQAISFAQECLYKR